jgi:hypothetical protein
MVMRVSRRPSRRSDRRSVDGAHMRARELEECRSKPEAPDRSQNPKQRRPAHDY